MPANDIVNIGAYLPTTYIYDVGQLKNMNANSQEFKELIVRLYQSVNSIIQILNIKDTAYYMTSTFQMGGVFFGSTNDINTSRPIFRTVVNFGALPNNTTKSVAHNIPNLGTTYSFTRLDCTSTKPNTLSIEIPGWDPASSFGSPIMITVDPANVNITTTSNMSAYTITWVILEFILN